MSADLDYDYENDDEYCERKEPSSWEWLTRLREEADRRRATSLPVTKTALKAPLRLILGDNHTPKPQEPHTPHLRAVPAQLHGSASLIFHFGVHLIEHALIQNVIDKTIAQSDISRTIELLRSA